MTIMFGDSSTKFSKGIVQDLQLRIGRSIIPANFYTLEMYEDIPLIFERGFLAIVEIVIVFLNHKKSFKEIDKDILPCNFFEWSSCKNN